MSDILPLVCTACGSRLKATLERDRFTCPSCGHEYLVRRDAAAATPSVSSAPTPAASPSPKADKTKVLLALLEQVGDAKKLDILLEAPNLLRLMLLYGWTETQVRQMLAAGKIPGELLLEVLKKEPNADVLLGHLNLPAEAPAKTKSLAEAIQLQQRQNRRILFGAGALAPSDRRRALGLAFGLLAGSLLMGCIGLAAIRVLQDMPVFPIALGLTAVLSGILGILQLIRLRRSQ